MQIKNQPFETDEHDLTGYASLDFKDGSFNSFAHVFDNYNSERFEPVTLKILLEGRGFTITLFAVDKTKQVSATNSKKRLPVKKFKMMMNAADFGKYISHFAVAFSNEKFSIEQMRVINK